MTTPKSKSQLARMTAQGWKAMSRTEEAVMKGLLMVEFARQLEGELDEANNRLKRLVVAHDGLPLYDEIERLKLELTAARQKYQELLKIHQSDEAKLDAKYWRERWEQAEQRLVLYVEYYEAHMALEFAIADFDVHNEAVDRLEKARATIEQEKK